MMKNLILVCLLIISASALEQAFLPQQSCNNFDGDSGCRSGTQTDNPDDWAGRMFQTPRKGDSLWRSGYQDYSELVGYPQVTYSSDRKSANVFVNATMNPQRYSDSTKFQLMYDFNGKLSDSNTFHADSSFTGELKIVVSIFEKNLELASIRLEPVDFLWNLPAVNQPSNYKNGQKGGIVEMFGWPYEEIEKECATLGKSGWMGVKVFPPQESVLDYEHPQNGELNPWYWLYQPVSYKLESRMGTRAQLKSMIDTCRQANVRVYADAVINHMVGNGNDMFPNHCSGGAFWGNKNSSGGSPFYTQGFAYQVWNNTGLRPGNEFPQVPYGPMDFHCARGLGSWTDPFILNYGWLVNLVDLNTEKEYVRQRIADYITDLLGLGISGIRIDAAKHISPDNLAHIFKKLKTNLGGGDLPEDFTAYLEVIIGGEASLLMCQDNSYNYGQYFENAMRGVGLSESDIYKIKIWSSDYPQEFPICGSWVISSERYAIQNECHDDQFPGSSSRDMQSFGSVLLQDRDVNKHRYFEQLMFTRTDGNWQIKLLLSSYTFMDSNGGLAPPDGHSDCSRCTTDLCQKSCSKNVPYRAAYDANACGYSMYENGNWVQGSWTRTHRDEGIIQAMRSWMGLGTNLSSEQLGLPSNCGSKVGQVNQDEIITIE